MRPDIDFLVQQEHHKDLLREAEHDQLVRLALAGNEKRTRFYLRIITWLGQRLVDLGCYLQAHFRAPTRKTSDLQDLNPCMKQGSS